ncbi:MAG: hypothetical protein PHO61_04445 [Candidatus ainarchaeum sp.]|nr:hypothetical protein [Candidatus ainarchaeum sp.]
MVEYNSKLDMNHKIHIPKSMVLTGFNDSIKIIPNYYTAVIFPSTRKLGEVKKSLLLIIADIENRLQTKVVK